MHAEWILHAATAAVSNRGGWCKAGMENHLRRWGPVVVLVAALMESLAAGVATTQEEEVCRWERDARRRRGRESQWLLGGRLVVETVAEAVTEMVAGGRGSKRRRKTHGRGCREERETDGGSWWLVGGCVGFLWCSWWWEDRWRGSWWLKATVEREGEEKEKITETRENGWFSWLTLAPIFSSLRP